MHRLGYFFGFVAQRAVEKFSDVVLWPEELRISFLGCFVSQRAQRNILVCFVAKRATEKFIMLGEIVVVLRSKRPQRNF